MRVCQGGITEEMDVYNLGDQELAEDIRSVCGDDGIVEL